VFLGRRIFYVVLLLSGHFIMKFGLIILMNLALMCYYMNYLPFIEMKRLRLEIFNESCLMICMYITPLFTDYVDRAELRYKFGNIYTPILILAFAVNLSYAVYDSLEKPCAACR